jgi:polysaccharide deacetylase family protein (PEP-CTERM system associated)
VSAHYLSFDVEDWFHAPNLRPALDWDAWDQYELRVVRNTHRILDLLDAHDTRATFFVLGHVADRAPELVAEIDARGHEIASHGYNHELLYDQSPAEVRADIQRSIDVIGSIVDQPIRGYRAPSFSITEWVLDILADLEFEYDSSNFPVGMHDRYGAIDVRSSETLTRTENGLREIQLPLLDLPGVEIPWAGGGYFRFIPYSVYRRGVERISQERDFVFYLHPWELDPEQPRITDVPTQYRVRHYTNLDKTETRLDRLLGDFDWQPIEVGSGLPSRTSSPRRRAWV